MEEASRTQRYEEMEERVRMLRQKSTETRTLARAYSDLAAALRVIPSRGDIWDIAQNDLVKKAESRAAMCKTIYEAQATEATDIEEKGI